MGEGDHAVQDGPSLRMIIEPSARVAVLRLGPCRNFRVAHLLHVLIVVPDLFPPVGVERRALRSFGLRWKLVLLRRQGLGGEGEGENGNDETTMHRGFLRNSATSDGSERN